MDADRHPQEVTRVNPIAHPSHGKVPRKEGEREGQLDSSRNVPYTRNSPFRLKACRRWDLLRISDALAERRARHEPDYRTRNANSRAARVSKRGQRAVVAGFAGSQGLVGKQEKSRLWSF